MNGKTAFMLVVGLVVMGIGGYLLYDHYQQRREARPVDAVVVSSSVYNGVQSDSPRITYRYTVDGETYRSSQVCPASTNCWTDASAVAERYSEGETVTAYVDPDDPSDAHLLQPGIPWKLYFVFGFGVLWTLVVLFGDPVEDA